MQATGRPRVEQENRRKLQELQTRRTGLPEATQKLLQ